MTRRAKANFYSTGYLMKKADLSELERSINELFELYVYVNGQYVKGDKAVIPVWDHGLLYGDGVFEGIRVYDGRIFKLQEHIERLYDSAKAIGLTVPLTSQELTDVTKEVVRKNALRNGHIRQLVTRGIGRPGLDPRRCLTPTVIVQAYPFPALLGERPLRLITSAVRRKSPISVDARIKSCNYLDNILAKIQANYAGVDDAVMLDNTGFIAEGTGENIFLVKRGIVSTPTTAACLHGITRETVIDLCKSFGWPTYERNITMHELYTADEAFCSGTAAELVPICEVDGRRIGSGETGPYTEALIDKFKELVRTEGTPVT
jgi:branched-chain amino acid aminotransferase